MTLFENITVVVMSAVLVISSPGHLMKFPPAVMRALFWSALCGLKSTTTRVYLCWCLAFSAHICYLGMVRNKYTVLAFGRWNMPTYHAPSVLMRLFQLTVAVVMYNVLVVSSPGHLMRFPLLFFCGLKSTKYNVDISMWIFCLQHALLLFGHGPWQLCSACPCPLLSYHLGPCV